jgi:putative serine protease PepD
MKLPAPPPPPARPARFDNAFMPPPPLPSESPFEEFPPTPAPDPAFLSQSQDEGEPEFSSETPPPLQPAALFAPLPAPQPYGGLPPPPPLNFGGGAGGPPPGRPGLPRPGGYLDPGYGANLHLPPAPPAAPAFDQGGGFGGGFPETVDFGRNSAPVVVRRSGPPGIIVLLTLIAGAAGGAWLGEKVTHNAVAALEASQQSAAAKAEETKTSSAPEIAPGSTSKQRK